MKFVLFVLALVWALPGIAQTPTAYSTGTGADPAAVNTAFGRKVDYVANVAALRLYSPPPGATDARVATAGYTVPGDGGAAFYRWAPTATGADDGCGTIQRTGVVTGRWNYERTQPELNPLACGAKCDNATTDDTAAFQLAINVSSVLALPVLVPGKCRITGNGLALNYTSTTDFGNRPVLLGSGASFSQLIFDSPTSNDAALLTASGTPATGQIRLVFSGFGLLRAASANTAVGLKLVDVNNVSLRDVWLNNFDIGLKANGVFNAVLDDVTIDRNNRGIEATFSSTSHPNAWVINGIKLNHNYQIGGHFVGATTVVFNGGDIEQNGADTLNTSAIALHMDGGSVDGAVSLVLNGMYFEANYGVADVVFTSDVNPTMARIAGSTFQRVGTSAGVINHILLRKTGTAAFKLKIEDSVFASFGGYTPGTTPVVGIAASPVGTNYTIIYDNVGVQNAGETPPTDTHNVWR